MQRIAVVLYPFYRRFIFPTIVYIFVLQRYEKIILSLELYESGTKDYIATVGFRNECHEC